MIFFSLKNHKEIRTLLQSKVMDWKYNEIDSELKKKVMVFIKNKLKLTLAVSIEKPHDHSLEYKLLEFYIKK